MTTIAPAPATTEVTTRDVLHRAADLLEEFGWCQGEMGSKEMGELCALSAIISAGLDLGKNPVGDCAAFDIHIGGSTPNWNDRPGRTKAEVVGALREAAERWVVA